MNTILRVSARTCTLAPRVSSRGKPACRRSFSGVAQRASAPTTPSLSKNFTGFKAPGSLATTPWKEYISTTPDSPTIYGFLELATETCQYLVVDPSTLETVVIDPVLDYNAAGGVISTTTADAILDFIQENCLTVVRILYVNTLWNVLVLILACCEARRMHMPIIFQRLSTTSGNLAAYPFA